MIDDAPLHRFFAFVDLTDQERAAMRDLVGPGSPLNAGKQIRGEGDEVSSLYFLHEGWVLSSIAHPNGTRQVLDVYRLGDVMGVPSLPFETAVESLVALTPAKVSVVPLQRLGVLFAAQPRLAALLYLNCQEERSTLMDRLAVSGQLSAKHSVAALLLLLFDSRPPSGACAAELYVPLTQIQIADVLGLSPVHVNRVLSELERDGLIERQGSHRHVYELPDVPRLRSLVGLPKRVRRQNPSWLPPAAP